MDQAVQTNQLHALVEPMANQLRSSLQGVERHQVIGRIIEDQSEDIRSELTDIFNGYLDGMAKREASDIDLGGPGCGGKVWYRIHGDKSPRKNQDDLGLIETDFLLHNIIMPSQREHLLRKKNLDFS